MLKDLKENLIQTKAKSVTPSMAPQIGKAETAQTENSSAFQVKSCATIY